MGWDPGLRDWKGIFVVRLGDGATEVLVARPGAGGSEAKRGRICRGKPASSSVGMRSPTERADCGGLRVAPAAGIWEHWLQTELQLLKAKGARHL
jgi:hypothetical protein